MADNVRPNPFRDPAIWGQIKFGPIFLPGVILSIDGAEKPEKWVFQMGLAGSQAVSIWRGTQLAESIKIMAVTYSIESFDPLWQMRDIMRPKLGRKPPTQSIVNPTINFVGITRGALRNIIPPKPSPGLAWTYGVELCEFNPMKIVPVGPADTPKAETENDRKAKEVVRLMNEASRF